MTKSAEWVTVIELMVKILSMNLLEPRFHL